MAQYLSNLPVGAKVKFGRYQVANEGANPITWTIVAKNHPDTNYPANSVTLHSTKILDLRAFDAKEPLNTNSTHHFELYGNGRYSKSNIQQWLNSRASAGQWYTAQHTYDEPPQNYPNLATGETDVYVNGGAEYLGKEGFLYWFSDNECKAILSTTVRTRILGMYGLGSYEDITAKIFLLSLEELGMVVNTFDTTPEGSLLEYYMVEANRKCSLTEQAYNNTSSTYKPSSLLDNYRWWTRTGVLSNGVNSCAYGVSDAGQRMSIHAYYSNTGVRPALNLADTTLVSDTVDSEGCYTVVWNAEPSTPSDIYVPSSVYGGQTAGISWGSSTDSDSNLAGYILECKYDDGEYTEIYRGTNTSYNAVVEYGKSTVTYRVCAYDTEGAKSSYLVSATREVINNRPPVISGVDKNWGILDHEYEETYSVTDEEGDEVTVTEAIDGVIIRQFVATLGLEYVFAVTGETWLKQSNGSHTGTITARDTFGNTSVRTYVFTKSVNSLSVGNTYPYESDIKPTRIKLSIGRTIPEGATFTVMVCNNGYDTAPTWEDATDSVIKSEVHVFENESKTADMWGVKIKVTVDRDTAEGACYISQIGGNFE